MFNLIKMDLYRLLHSVSAYVILLFVIGIALFAISMTNIDLELMAEDPQFMAQTEEAETKEITEAEVDTEKETVNEAQIGIYADTNPAWVQGKIDVGDMIGTEVKSGLLLILCTIFTAIFVNAEQKNEYIKNIAGQFTSRWLLALSKFVAVAFQTPIMLLVFAGSVAIFSYFYFGSRLYLDSLSSLLRLLAVQYLLHFSFSALVSCLCILTKSSAFSMVIGILLCCGVTGPLYVLINNGIHNLWPKSTFNVVKYVLDGNVNSIGINASSGLLLRATAVGFAFLILSALCSMVIMQKRDVK